MVTMRTTIWAGAVLVAGSLWLGCGGSGSGGAGGAGSTSASTSGGNHTTSGSTSSGASSSGSAAVTCDALCAKVTSANCPGGSGCPAQCAGFSESCKSCVAGAANICAPNECQSACSAGGSDCTAGGAPCNFNSDCTSGDTCNGKTAHCFDPVTAVCIGTPCQFDSDCASGESCNSASSTCQQK